MNDNELGSLAEQTLEACRKRGWRIGTAESCTGGLIAAALTEIAGSSDVLEGGFVTYSNEVKMSSLGVEEVLLRSVGAVSMEVAVAMAEGALSRLPRTTLTVAVTGVAGPGGGSAEKPVGLVHFALARREELTMTWHQIFSGDRTGIRRATVIDALTRLKQRAQDGT